ncbi:flagellar hook-associated protein 2 [Nitratiruptor sp. YY08-26]|uniref:flagellar filament capping protein FliD n=1 Tax=unclassified Nitratiruptor TaxID=2624044 RepID=UPI0019164619|nr:MULTISPECIES: flagellar filament capping protein FliD [unclassified Nitratiruptor]BCD61882.1 flagellar hook-associated protein 2 [Nitratiruptor sp. YY08-13]BCD65817.1 flagellar hook-associated protein 2 [Nitratiruptor sp. YY08-26]
MAGEINFSGLSNTGFDYDAYLSKLAELKSISIQNIQAQQTKIVSKQTSIVSIKSALSSLSSPLQKLQQDDTYQNLEASLSNSKIASVSVDASSAQTGEYELEVVQKARANSYVVSWSQDIDDASKTLGANGQLSIEYKKDGQDQSLTIDYSDKSLNDIVAQINQSEDLKATIVNTGSNTNPSYKLLITAKNTGLDNAITGVSDSDGDDTVGFDTRSSVTYETLQAQDAQIKLNGMLFTSVTDRFENILSGVTIEAKEAGESSLTIKKNYNDIESSLKKILDTYNTLKDTITKETGKSGALKGETSLFSITRGFFGQISELARYGFIQSPGDGETAKGKLELDREKLEDFLQNNANAAKIIKDFARNTENFVSTYTDNLTDMNNRYTQQVDRLQKEMEIKSNRIHEELSAMRKRFIKVNAYLSQLKSLQTSIENFAKSFTQNNQ